MPWKNSHVFLNSHLQLDGPSTFSTASYETGTILILFPSGKGGFVQDPQRGVSHLSIFRDPIQPTPEEFSRGRGGTCSTWVMANFSWGCPRVDGSGDKNAIGWVTICKSDPQKSLTVLGPDPWGSTGIQWPLIAEELRTLIPFSMDLRTEQRSQTPTSIKQNGWL